ncbi:hypothetical protein ABZX92_23790 [Lentzea sp. NPDC006480]|uniref:hypothetical protein n=1 Tax=Lentzea sp. NPDC006480 TaxID=3157176 RepID=UPI0033B9D4A3
MTGPRVRKAPHVDARWDDAVEMLLTAIGRDRLLYHLGHYTDGFDDIVVEIVDSEEPEDPDDSDDSDDSEESGHSQTARTLSTAVSQLEADLIAVRTGSLIRVVLQTGQGVAYCDSVVPDQHVIGFGSTEPPPAPLPWTAARNVRAADELTSELATALRARISQQPLNPGGWKTLHDPDDDVDPAVVPVATPESLRVQGDVTSTLADQCRKFVDPRDLHYVALWADCEQVFTIDVFDDLKVGRFFHESITPAQRRRFYADLSRRLPSLVTQFGRMCRQTLGGRVERLVLDVEMGAIYYYRVEAGEYLVGVTLDQSEVYPADEKVARLAAAARPL